MKESDQESYLQLHDLELADLTRAGNQEAAKEIQNRYRPRLYATAMAMLFSHDQAEKAVNHTLQDLPQTVSEFKNDSLLLTWLCRKLIQHILNEHQFCQVSSEIRETASESSN